jgi:hypothetical protein
MMLVGTEIAGDGVWLRTDLPAYLLIVTEN